MAATQFRFSHTQANRPLSTLFACARGLVNLLNCGTARRWTAARHAPRHATSCRAAAARVTLVHPRDDRVGQILQLLALVLEFIHLGARWVQSGLCSSPTLHEAQMLSWINPTELTDLCYSSSTQDYILTPEHPSSLSTTK